MPRRPMSHGKARVSLRRIDGVGPRPAPIMFVGEGPGELEDRIGRPFVGPSGELLDDLLFKTAGPDRALCFVTNVVRYHIYGNKDPLPEDIARDYPALVAEFREVKPEVVVTLGAFATRFFMGPDWTMELCHGLPHRVRFDGRDIIVFPAYHPAFGLRETDAMALVFDDFKRLSAYLHGDLPLHEPDTIPRDYRLVTRFTGWPRYAELDGPWLGVDTEGSAEVPWGGSVSWQTGQAVVVKAEDTATWESLARYLANAPPGFIVFVQGAMHDIAVLRALRVEIAHWFGPRSRPRVIDTQGLLFHHALHPPGLKESSYRLSGMRMDSYEDVIAPAQQAIALSYLSKAVKLGTQAKTPAVKRWAENPTRLVVDDKGARISKPWSVLRRMTRILADATKPNQDLAARWWAIEPDVREPVERILGPMKEAGLEDVRPQQVAIDYAACDADATRRNGPILMDLTDEAALAPIRDIDFAVIPYFERMQSNGFPVVPQYYRDLSQEMARKQRRVAKVLAEVTGRAFNPNSTHQVGDLVYREMGLTPARYTSTGLPSTSKKSLENLRSDPIIDLILKSREYGKVEDGFCEQIIDNSRPVGRGQWRCYATLRVFRVKTGRPAANQPNLLAIPVRTALGKRVRGGFMAPPGHELATADLSQIEMRVMAHLSRDERMCEIYHRPADKFEPHERDLHIMTAVLVFGVKPQDVEKWQRTIVKSTGFGILMGITGIGLADQFRLYGLDQWGPDECDRFIVEWLKVYKGVDRYQKAKQSEARRYGETRDMWGRRFLLPGVWSRNGRVKSEAERQACALVIQASAQGLIKKVMARLDTEHLPALRRRHRYVEPILQIHDELIFDYKAKAREDLKRDVLGALTQTVKLRVPVEANWANGDTWAQLEK